MDGTITANGHIGIVYGIGGGAGGSIHSRCRTLRGAGLMQANGGNGGGSGGTGGGGGGRIAAWRVHHYWQGTNLDANSVSGGTGTYETGACGTVFLGDIPGAGSIIKIR